MDLRIVGWSYKNIRGMRDVQIQLGDLPAQWTLIQMPNGTGKTTTLTLMRLALSGETPDPQLVRSFRPDDLTVSGEFVLRITVDDEKCWLILQFDYVECTMQPFTSRASLDSGGYEPGRRLKRDLQGLLTTAFTRLFVFDGELAKSIRDISKDEASRAIRTLYQLDRVALLRTSAQRILDAEQEASVVRTEHGHSVIAGRLNAAETKLRSLKAAKDELETSREALSQKIAALDAKRQERISASEGLGERLNSAKAKQAEIAARLQVLTSHVAELSRNPAAISRVIQVRLHELAARLQKLKLPKTTSSEFFHELAKAPECICGRPIGPHERCQIEARASEYLGHNQVAVINAMKEALRTSVADPNLLVDGVEQIKAQMRRRKQVDHDFDRIYAELEEQGDDQIEAIRIELESYRSAFDEQDRKYLALTATSKGDQQSFGVDWKGNISLCEKEVAKARDSLTAATNTMRLMEQSTFVQNALHSVEKRAYEALRDRVQQLTNAKLKMLLPGESIRVSEIGTSLMLSTDALATKDSVSEGQGLAVAYAFLASLFEDAPYRLPFVVDSPAVSLDILVRREVAELIPSLFGQAIFFVISSEREGFAESFYGRSGAKFITVETDKDGRTRVEEGIEPFKAFHSDEDEPLAEVEA
jgi:DNA sulfur modification protein DndD